MRYARKPVLVFLILSLFTASASAQEEEMKFEQYAPSNSSCLVNRTQAASGTAILLAWFGKLIVDGLERAAQKAIREHTHSYSNKPGYVLLDDPQQSGPVNLWAMDNTAGAQTSCFRFKRTAGASKDTSLELTGRLWKSEQGIRVRAESLRWPRMAARHSGKNAALSISFTMHSLRNTADGGSVWSSPEALIVSQEHSLPRLKPGGETNLPDEPLIKGPATYQNAVLLPLPPKLSGEAGNSLVAFQVTVVEAGRPGFGLRAYAKFLADNKDDLSQAMTDALGKIR